MLSLACLGGVRLPPLSSAASAGLAVKYAGWGLVKLARLYRPARRCCCWRCPAT